MEIELKIKALIVFKADGLNEEWVKSKLEEDVLVTDVFDTTLSYMNENGEEVTEPIRAFEIEGSFAKMLRIKLRWDCFTTPQSDWIFYPRGNGMLY